MHAYIGIKARYFEIKALLREDYIRKVVHKDPAVSEELQQFSTMRERYLNNFERYPVNDAEYEIYVSALNNILGSQVQKVLNDF